MTTNKRKIMSIILAAGKGSRMQSPHLHKVCFQIDGKPVIARSIETYTRCGIQSHYIVVGQVLGQVMQAASMAPGNHFFCHQFEQKGTGDATKAASQLLKAMDYSGAVFVVAGDKVLDEAIIQRLINGFYESNCDVAIIVGDIHDNPSAGRIICDENSKAVGIIESPDVAKVQLLSILKQLTSDRDAPASEVESLALAYLKSENKAASALGQIWYSAKARVPITKQMLDLQFSESDYYFTISGKIYDLDYVTASNYANTATYIFKSSALYSSLDKLEPRNAQNEEYLTDAISILANDGANICLIPVDYPEQVMAFNTPEEFAKIEDYYSGRKSLSISGPPKTKRLASEWLRRLDTDHAIKYLADIYGIDLEIAEDKRRLLVSMLRSYVNNYADEEVIITRAPGRVNVMGRHIDSQGGRTNLMAIEKDLYLIAGARDDGQVRLHNLQSREMPTRNFVTDDIIAEFDGKDWLKFVDSKTIKSRVEQTRGDWSHYVTAPFARFQAKYSHLKLKGMNIVAAGNVPMAAGLSSSSALVVAVAEAIAHLNGIDISAEQFVELCGEGEWYVGTRGGTADHAAMKFAQSGKVIHVGFIPFQLIESVPFPDGYSLVICNSQYKAHKSGSARDTFNHRIACYNIGRELFKIEFPDFASKIEHIRDINIRNFGIENHELLEMLKKIPYKMTRDEVIGKLPKELYDKYLSSHSSEYNEYYVRGVVMFGLSECERSRLAVELLSNERVEEFGQLMNISHNGDRVVFYNSIGEQTKGIADYSNESMDKLIQLSKKGDKSADIAQQPGAYSCSIPEIDRMIDIAISDNRVLGAQMLGAGLGGCIAVLIKSANFEHFCARLISSYYEPSKLLPEMLLCRPVSGSRVINF